jgi:hypothetical protein
MLSRGSLGCCWIVAEKLAAAFTSTSNVALANADVARAKANNRPKHQAIISDAVE